MGLAATASAESTFDFSPNSGTFEVGEVVDITINVSNDFEGADNGARGFAFRFEWDPDVVRIVGGAAGLVNDSGNPFTTEVQTEYDEAEGTILRAYAVFPITQLVYDGPAASFQVEFLEAAASTSLTWVAEDTRFTGFDQGVTTDAVRTPATFTVISDVVECVFTLDPTEQNFDATGGAGDFDLNASDESCDWTAVSNDAWITDVSAASGTGSDTISFTVAANEGPERTGTITAGGQTFTVTQDAAPIECTFDIEPDSADFDADGGVSSVTVLASDESCDWTASTEAGWITITSGASGTGDGTVTYEVAPNDEPEAEERTGEIVVAGQIHTVVQAAPEDEEPEEGGVELIAHTSFQDAWVAQNSGGTFQTPVQLGATGFVQNPFAGERILAGDFNGDGLTDLIMVTPAGELWKAERTGPTTFGSVTFQSDGWEVSALDNSDVVVGDFNGSGRADVVQLTPTGDIYAAFTPEGGAIGEPEFVQESTIITDRVAGIYVIVGDFNGDGLDDLAMLDNAEQMISVALSQGETGFAAPALWGTATGDMDLAKVRVGDVTGDGQADLVYNATDDSGDVPLSTTWVMVSTGDGFAEAAEWGDLGFHDDPNRGAGWATFVGDVNGNGIGDLIQVNEFGEAWVALSNGVDGFADAERNAALGVVHRPDGPWQVFVAPVSVTDSP